MRQPESTQPDGLAAGGLAFRAPVLARLLLELGGRMRANSVGPAAMDKSMLQAGFRDNRKKLAALADRHPSGSIGTPGNVAAFVLVLASEVSPYVTGAVINPDGGISSGCTTRSKGTYQARGKPL